MLPNGLVLDGADYSARTFDSHTEEDCVQLQDCMTMFNRFQDPDSRIFWATRFCFRSSGKQCERNRRIQEGIDPASGHLIFFPMAIVFDVSVRASITEHPITAVRRRPNLGVVLLSSFRRESESSYCSWILVYAGMTAN